MGAMEAIKVLAEFGEPLANRLLVCDLRDFSFNSIKLNRDPKCVCCGDLRDS